MLKVKLTNSFLKDLEIAEKRGFDIDILDEVVEKLKRRKQLEPKYRDHKLKGIYDNWRECHVKPDWLLIYRIDNDVLELILFRFGTHSDLF